MANVNTSGIIRAIREAGERVATLEAEARRHKRNDLPGLARETWQAKEEARLFLAGILAATRLLGSAELELDDEVMLWANDLALWRRADWLASIGDHD